MREVNRKTETKCIAVNLPVELVRKLEAYKTRTGKSKNAILVEFIRNGLTAQTKGER